MLDIFNLFMLAIIAIIFYSIFFRQSKSTNKIENERFNSDDLDDFDNSNGSDDSDGSNDSNGENKIHRHLVEIQFHNDYRDTLDAFDAMASEEKQLFNQSYLPVKSTADVPSKEIKELVKNFISALNAIVIEKIDDQQNVANWRDNAPHKKHDSGWAKQQRALGLPESIYNEPKGKSIIKLMKIKRIEKHETDHEIKYVIFMILQKINVDDQIYIKVEFVIDKKDVNLDRDFFNDNNSFDVTVGIEEIFVIGYHTKHNFGKPTVKETFYTFNELGDSNDQHLMFNPKDIVEILNKKRREHNNERQKH